MRSYVTALVVGMCAWGSFVSAQLPPQPPQSPRPTPAERPTARGSEGIVTLEGCLVREADVQGRWPKNTENAGVTGDPQARNFKLRPLLARRAVRDW